MLTENATLSYYEKYNKSTPYLGGDEVLNQKPKVKNMLKQGNDSSFVTLAQYKKLEAAYKNLSDEYKSLCVDQIFLTDQLKHAILIGKSLMQISTIKKEL